MQSQIHQAHLLTQACGEVLGPEMGGNVVMMKKGKMFSRRLVSHPLQEASRSVLTVGSCLPDCIAAAPRDVHLWNCLVMIIKLMMNRIMHLHLLIRSQIRQTYHQVPMRVGFLGERNLDASVKSQPIMFH